MNITQQPNSLTMKQTMQRAESAPFTAEDRQRPLTILLVDDDDLVRDMAKTILAARGCTVLEAKDGNACLKMAQDYSGPIDLVVTDMLMPGMNGRELIDVLVTLRGRTRVLYMSGYPNEAVLTHCGFYPAGVFLHKPFSPDILLRRVREALLS